MSDGCGDEAALHSALAAFFNDPATEEGKIIDDDAEQMQFAHVTSSRLGNDDGATVLPNGASDRSDMPMPVLDNSLPSRDIAGSVRRKWREVRAHVFQNQIFYASLLVALLFLSFSAIYFVTVPSILAPAAPAMGMCSATYADAPFSPAPPRMHENLVAEQQLERSKMSAWQILGAFFSIVMLVTTTYPAWAGLIMAYYPRDVINTAVYAISTPFIGFFPSQFLAFNKADGGATFGRVVRSMNRLRWVAPFAMSFVLVLSTAFIGASLYGSSPHADSSPRMDAVAAFSSLSQAGGSAQAGINSSATIDVVSLPYDGQWFPPSFSASDGQLASSISSVVSSAAAAAGSMLLGNTQYSQMALINSSEAAKCDAKATGLPVFHGTVDSGCSGSVTDDARG